jgi:hypothetical protein
MNWNSLILGVFYGIIAQIGTFLQLQGNIKYGWYQKYPIILLASAVPLAWLYIKSVELFVLAFDGKIWPSRFIGFSLGVIVFAIMSRYLFGEPITLKVIISIILALLIVLTQIYL